MKTLLPLTLTLTLATLCSSGCLVWPEDPAEGATPATDGGASDEGGSLTFPCGTASCAVGVDLCHLATPSGASDAAPSKEPPKCERVPAACASTPQDCDCIRAHLVCPGGSSAYCDRTGDVVLAGCTGV